MRGVYIVSHLMLLYQCLSTVKLFAAILMMQSLQNIIHYYCDNNQRLKGGAVIITMFTPTVKTMATLSTSKFHGFSFLI